MQQETKFNLSECIEQGMLLTTDVKEFIKKEDDLLTLLFMGRLSNAEFDHKRSKLIGNELRN